jgi:phosphoribosyl 1,2-cyclic phosphodiesterase
MARARTPGAGQRRPHSCRDTIGRIEVHALASGSSGNATLVQSAGVNLLIDAGMPIRALTNALRYRGVGASDLHAILLTHEHTDHISAAAALARRTRAPIYATEGTLIGLTARDEVDSECHPIVPGEVVSVGPFQFRAFDIPHDANQPTGFVVETSAARIAYCTDVGSITPNVREALDGANLAIIEANHDVDMLWRGPYTQAMKERVASPTGHLSNADCADVLASTLERNGPMTVWLAHLSRVNNSPSLAHRSVIARIAEQTRVPVSLHVALRDQPSVHWVSGRQCVQLSLL